MKWLALPFAVLAAPVAAETGYACAFTVECAVAGDCVPVEITTEIAVSADGGQWIFLTSTADALPASRLSAVSADVQVFSAHLDDIASTLVTINPDGTALRSLHYDGSDALTYFGVCEATE